MSKVATWATAAASGYAQPVLPYWLCSSGVVRVASQSAKLMSEGPPIMGDPSALTQH